MSDEFVRPFDPMGRTTKRRYPKPLVARCMLCQVLSERDKGNVAQVDYLIDQEMVRRTQAWLLRKFQIVWSPYE